MRLVIEKKGKRSGREGRGRLGNGSVPVVGSSPMKIWKDPNLRNSLSPSPPSFPIFLTLSPAYFSIRPNLKNVEARRRTTVARSSIGLPVYCKSLITTVSDVTTVAARVVGIPLKYLIREKKKGRKVDGKWGGSVIPK
jgi:hypothetical protein